MRLAKFLKMIKEWITMEDKLKRLRIRLSAPIIDKFGGMIAVEEGSMEREWGLPLVRHNRKDWYPLKKEVRE